MKSHSTTEGSVIESQFGVASVPSLLTDAAPLARSDSPLRVAVVTPIPTPYRDPFWNEFARTPGIELTVLYCSNGKPDRPWTANWRREYASEVLYGWNFLRWLGPDASCFWNPLIARRLSHGNFDAILIGGYNHLTMWMAMFFAVFRKIPFFLMCESHLHSHRPGWKQWVKRPILRWVVEHARGCLPTGCLSTEFLIHYGAVPEMLTPLPNVPDVVKVEAEVQRLRRNQDSPGPPEFAGRPVILFVGRLIPKKRAELVIRAFHRLERANNAALVIVGDGPLRPDLEKLVDDLEIRKHVWFTGFVEPTDVLRWYARANVFVLPSSETWGVAVIEALAAGVPVVISDEVGCHVDVVTDPDLGTVVPARNEQALCDALKRHLNRNPSLVDRRPALENLRYRLRYDVLAKSLQHALRMNTLRRTDTSDQTHPIEIFKCPLA